MDPIRAARAAAGRGAAEDPLAGFDVVASVPVSVADDIATAADPLRGYAALYVGGMGSREQNFYNALARRMGFDEAAQRVQDLYLDHKPRDAAAAVPIEFIDATSLHRPDRAGARPARGLRRGRRHHPVDHARRSRSRGSARPAAGGRGRPRRRRSHVMSSAIGYGDSLILGIVEGLTEFLPVSSTGHLTIAESLLGKQTDDPAVTAFTVIIQFGAIVATFLYFRRDIVRLVGAWVRGVVSAPARDNPDYRFAWYVIAGSLPVVVAGVLAKSLITGPLRNLWVVAVAFAAWSAVMYVAEGRSRQKYGEADLTLKASLIIGLVQCAALVPGVSRSGATISAGLLQDYNRVAATRLSFFLAIPALTGASLYELKDVNTSVVGWGPLLLGMVVSFLVAYAAIAWLLRYVAHHPITIFVWYRLGAAVLLALLLAAGVVSPT